MGKSSGDTTPSKDRRPGPPEASSASGSHLPHHLEKLFLHDLPLSINATARAHRIGQERPVTVTRLVSEKTVEEKIMELHRMKPELAEGLLEGTDSAARPDIAIMRELLSL
ncbi:MAG: hypothetical protein ACP5OS_09075 [Leptospirillia bacterium]